MLLMSVTLAVAAVRLARKNTLVQQMAATEALAAVDTICVDKTGHAHRRHARAWSRSRSPTGAARGRRTTALARFAHSAGERNRTLETIAERYPGEPERVVAEVPFSSAWKWSGLTLDGGGARQLRAGRARRAQPRGRARAAAEGCSGGSSEHTAAGRRVVAFGRGRGAPADDPAASRRRGSSRARSSCSRSSCGPTPPRRSSSCAQQVDLKLISGDARETVTAVAHAVGVREDARVIEGPDLPADDGGLAHAAERNTIFCRITPEQKKALVGALADRGRFTAMIGDGVNDVPALKRARLAVAMGSGSQVTKGVADIVLLQGPVLDAAARRGRGSADCPQHPPPRPPVPNEDRSTPRS